jgi:hypothetical protein
MFPALAHERRMVRSFLQGSVAVGLAGLRLSREPSRVLAEPSYDFGAAGQLRFGLTLQQWLESEIIN